MFRVWDIQFTQNLYPNWFVYLTIASSVISLGLYRFGATVPLVHDQSMAATIAVMAVVALAPLKIAYFISHQCLMSIPILYIHSHSISLFLLRTFYFNAATSSRCSSIHTKILVCWRVYDFRWNHNHPALYNACMRAVYTPAGTDAMIILSECEQHVKNKNQPRPLGRRKKKKWPNQSVCWTNKCSSSSFS